MLEDEQLAMSRVESKANKKLYMFFVKVNLF